jgi:hypothetical protein
MLILGLLVSYLRLCVGFVDGSRRVTVAWKPGMDER